jgi:diadenosine tetraphosphate (Ap4A) HIT family hydrolase
VDEEKKFLEEHFKPDGFNVGINVGSAAGQTVIHGRIQLISRRAGTSTTYAGACAA